MHFFFMQWDLLKKYANLEMKVLIFFLIDRKITEVKKTIIKLIQKVNFRK